jgi:hypothetical protein
MDGTFASREVNGARGQIVTMTEGEADLAMSQREVMLCSRSRRLACLRSSLQGFLELCSHETVH